MSVMFQFCLILADVTAIGIRLTIIPVMVFCLNVFSPKDESAAD